MERLLIYGGSFDPVHPDHLALAKAAAKRLDAKVIFQISRKARWKNPSSDPNKRLELLRLVLSKKADFPYEIDDSWIKDENKPDFTIDCLREYRERHPEAEICFLIGGDSVNTFERWKEAGEIARIAQLYFVQRKDILPNKETIEKFGLKPLDGVETKGYSSTAIRDLVYPHPFKEAREFIEENRMYYAGIVASYIDKARYEHSCRVAELAMSFLEGEEANDAYIAGILHDIAKDMPLEEQIGLSKPYDKYPESRHPDWVYHQFAGAALAKKLFAVSPRVEEAIASHCTGAAGMDDVAKAIYAADKIEPGRHYDSQFMIDACHKGIEEGFRLVFDENIKFLSSRGYSCDDTYTQEAMRFYLKGE